MNLILIIVILAGEWSAIRLTLDVKFVDGINVNVVLVDVITKRNKMIVRIRMEEYPS